MICALGWAGRRLRVCPAHLTQVLWDGPRLVGALPYPPWGPQQVPAPGEQPCSCCSLTCIQLLVIPSVAYPGNLRRAEKTRWLQIRCLSCFHTGRSHHICLVKHTLSRGKNVHMWHMNVSQLQPECSFLREICRKRQKGLLIFKARIKSPSQAGGCKRHQGPCKFGRIHIHMHTHSFNLTSCQHIPSTEGRRRLHRLTELGRLQY